MIRFRNYNTTQCPKIQKLKFVNYFHTIVLLINSFSFTYDTK